MFSADRPEPDGMKNKAKKKDLDGTGRHPRGDRHVRKLKDKVPDKFFFQALGWVYRHLRYRVGATIWMLAQQAGVSAQTVSQIGKEGHALNAVIEMRVAEALGYHAEEIRGLTRRWARKLRGRKAAKA